MPIDPIPVVVPPDIDPPFGNERPFTGLTALIGVVDTTTSEATPIAYISGIDLTLEKEIIEILAFGMKFKEKVPAIHDWSASIDGVVALIDGGTQKKFYDAFDGDTLLTFSIFLNKTTYFIGTGYVQSFNISGAPDDAMNLTSEIAGSGAVVLTLPGEAEPNP